MTEQKFPIGSQWKTRAGHRAVVVEHDPSLMKVWHSCGGCSYPHLKGDGAYDCVVHCQDHHLDLLTPWTEPHRGTVWVNVHDSAAYAYSTRKDADDSRMLRRIACIEVPWVEGQGLEKP